MDGSVTGWVDMRMDGCADGWRDDHIDRCTDTCMATYQFLNCGQIHAQLLPVRTSICLFSYVVQAVSDGITLCLALAF